MKCNEAGVGNNKCDGTNGRFVVNVNPFQPLQDGKTVSVSYTSQGGLLREGTSPNRVGKRN